MPTLELKIAPGDVEVCFASDGFEGDGPVTAPENFSLNAPVDAGFGGIFDAHAANGAAVGTSVLDPKFGEAACPAENAPFLGGEGVGDISAVRRGAGLAASPALERSAEEVSGRSYPANYQEQDHATSNENDTPTHMEVNRQFPGQSQ